MNNPLPATNNHLDAAAKAVAQAGNQLHAAATSGAEEISQTAVNEANRIGELARDWLKRNARTALDAAGAVREQAALANDRTQRYVRDEPVKAVLIAAATGAVVTGLLMLATRSPRERR